MQTNIIVIVNTRINIPIRLKMMPLIVEVILKCEVVFLIACIMISPFSKNIVITINQEYVLIFLTLLR
jgi:hypothetical protein